MKDADRKILLVVSYNHRMQVVWQFITRDGTVIKQTYDRDLALSLLKDYDNDSRNIEEK